MARRFLVFSAGKTDYALDLGDVAEVMEPREVFPLPVAPPCFRGIINFHGTLTAVLDLPHFLRWGSAARTGKFLVLDGRLAALALWVDAVGSIVSEDALLSVATSEDPLIEALLETEGGAVQLIGVEALLQRLEEGVPTPAPTVTNNR